jgi:hypothetical protein
MLPPSSGRKCMRGARSAGYLDKLPLRNRKGIIPLIIGYTANSHYVLESSCFKSYPETSILRFFMAFHNSIWPNSQKATIAG